MKTRLSLLLALCAGLFTLAPVDAAAGHRSSRRVSHQCGSCGHPVYQELRVVGYYRDGCPIYRWVTVSHHCHHRGHYHHDDRGGRVEIGPFRIWFR